MIKPTIFVSPGWVSMLFLRGTRTRRPCLWSAKPRACAKSWTTSRCVSRIFLQLYHAISIFLDNWCSNIYIYTACVYIYIISYHIVPYCIILYYIVLYYIISYHIILYCIILYIILYYILYYICKLRQARSLGNEAAGITGIMSLASGDGDIWRPIGWRTNKLRQSSLGVTPIVGSI